MTKDTAEKVLSLLKEQLAREQQRAFGDIELRGERSCAIKVYVHQDCVAEVQKAWKKYLNANKVEGASS